MSYEPNKILAPTEHHPRGMSRWPAVIACPCFKSRPAGADAEIGTETHKRLAEWLDYMRSHAGDLPHEDEQTFTIWERGAWDVARFIRDMVIAAGRHFADLLVEERVQLPDGIFGTVDCSWWSGSDLHVLDFKTMRNPGRIYAAQEAGYALAIINEDGRTAAAVGKVYLHTAYGDARAWDTVETSVSGCEAIRDAAMAAFAKFADGKAVPSHCAWCDLCAEQATCTETTALAVRVAKAAPPTTQEAVKAMTPADCARWCYLAETVAKWADALRGAVKERMTAGGEREIRDEASGAVYTLRETSGRKTPRVRDAWAKAKAYGVKPEDFQGALKLGAADLKRLLRGAGQTAANADAIIESVSDAGKGSLQLVRA